MENLEMENFNKIEDLFGEMESLKKLVGLTITECFEFRATALEQNEIKENYIKGQTMTNAIFDLLHYQTKELREFIENYQK